MAIDKIESAGLATSTNQPNFRNIVINGDMSIAQRGTSFTSLSSSLTYTLDRFALSLGTAGTFTVTQDTDVPSGQGFSKSLKLDCTTANASLSAGSYLQLATKFEGQNLQYLKKGTSSAESLTLSFWVKSNKTGTFIVELDDNDNARNINKSFTIDSASTWEKKTITFAGDTTGAFGNDNGDSLRIFWWLGAGTDYTSGTLQTSWGSTVNANRAVGQVNLADSTSNEFYITGVQLEAGTTASDFEFLPVDVNLQRCQRYFEQMTADYPGLSASNKGTYSGVSIYFKVIKRATPTMSDVTLRNMQTADTATVSASTSGWTTEAHARYSSTATNGSTGDGCHIYNANGIQADAEL